VTALPCYLAEVRYDPDEAAELRVCGADQLIGLLTSNIEHEHYSWDSYEVVRLLRYDNGTLTPLTMHDTGEDHDSDDWLYWHYEVCDPKRLNPDGSHVAELAFTVRIDGRA
jgi:hypothetical protein